MTKYSADVLRNGEWESIALFDSGVSDEAMVAFAFAQFENGNSLILPANDIRILDLDTGELVFDWQDSADEDGDYWDDGCPIEDNWDESAYDPYLGCDVYETEPFCDMW